MEIHLAALRQGVHRRGLYSPTYWRVKKPVQDTLADERIRQIAIPDPTSFPRLFQRAASAQFRRPLLHLVSTQQHRHRYLTQCVPLHKAALKGDWKEASKIMEQDNTLFNAAITKGWATVLHIAGGTNHVHFVEELVRRLERDDLELQDEKGNTAFCFAAAVGNVEIAKIMLRKNESLPRIRGGEGLTPLHMALLQGRSAMAWYLLPKSKEILEESDWEILFHICINSELYDLALEMLTENKMLAFARIGDTGETGLHVLARKASGCCCQSQRYGKHLLHFCTNDTFILKLINFMWEIFLTKLDDSTLMNSIRQPSQVTFIAAEAGNFEFLSVVISTYPDLIWELDTIGRTIIHSAVLHRHASIFNLIHEIGPMKDLILTFVDDEGNNLLHCAARLAPPNRLNIVSGAALQMMLELSWFEEVKKIMIPLFIEMENSERFTPRQIFTKEHEELLKNGESWMKRTANSCMVVSTLIATGVFSAAFSVPGGNNDNTRSPNYMEKPAFLVFVLSDAIAFISSSTSIIIFLSILMSRYAEEDFLKTLPLMLISGLVALFISIISMMVGFSSAFFITYYHGLKWVPNFIAALAFVPIPLFIFLQFPLWSDIVYSTYICSSLFRPSKPMIH
ncbi:putative ankyrin repeat-containing domain, PGG domain-containing protein [Lupinus albus]|uniref:Putative ankyrin repeat-containing domain, PGG domain-containing protein n=1 Tax=Lupinus albus TaxID=3870 RepID=A0A6A4NKY0_LUPAL|nr:putative ankyrin repeat-containing domain, PGG domain-containing protein [Lupinus albus]